MDPRAIENASMTIIRAELEKRGLLAGIPEARLPVAMRAIHSTADFDFAEILEFSPDVLDAAKRAFGASPTFVTDTNMIVSGINKGALAKAGGRVRCYMADEDVAREAAARGTTRAAVSMERAVAETPGAIFVVGNAPTALIRLCELTEEGRAAPALVVGVPVGFVNVVESKARLKTLGQTPYIVANGLKGGSTVAVAVVNALLYENVGR